MTPVPRPCPRAVVFDLDGTLLDTMTSAPLAYAKAIRAISGRVVTPREVVAAWQIGPAPVVLAHFAGRKITAEDIECFYGYFDAAVTAARPFPGVVELIGILQQRRYRLGIFTSATRRAATSMLAAAGLERHFHTVICGDDVSAPKPDPLGLQLACRELGVSPAEAAYVGDAEVDLQCAEAAGALGILASWASETKTVPGCRHVALQPGHISGLLAAPH